MIGLCVVCCWNGIGLLCSVSLMFGSSVLCRICSFI